jgi:glycosyltransferase involved in cell wall biosynthesis
MLATGVRQPMKPTHRVSGTGPLAPRRILISANMSWNVLNFRRGLVRALVVRGYDVIVAAPDDGYANRLAELGCRHIRLPMDRKGISPLGDLVLLYRFLRLIQRERPDVFLGFTIKPNVYGSLAAACLGVPVLNTVSGLGTAFISNTWLTNVAKRLYRIALRRSALVFFQNEDDRSLFVDEALVARERTALLPGSGIDLERFRPSHRPCGEAGGFRFLLLGRMLWDKGIGEYVAAARLVRRELPHTRFQLLGLADADNRTAIDPVTIEGWAAEGVIEFLGASDDVRTHIAGADCVVLPSYREGTPRALLEAAAMEKPLIATNVPGCREVVEHGRNGYLCAARSTEDLAARMIQLARESADRRTAMGRASRRKVEQQFDERMVTRRYLSAIEDALSPSNVAVTRRAGRSVAAS